MDDQTQKIDRLIANKKAQAEKLKELRQIEINNAVTKGLNPNAEMKDSGIEWLGKIPKHWDVKHLKRAFKFFNNIRIPLSSEERADLENIYDYYGASGIIDKVDRYLFDGDFILIGEDGANLVYRSTPLAFKASGKFWVNNHAHILQPIKGDIDYNTFMLESLDYSIYISGSAQPKLTIEALSSMRVIVPPKDEQIEIANYLKERTTAIDQLIKNIEAQIEKLQELRKIKIYEAVTGKIKVNAYAESVQILDANGKLRTVQFTQYAKEQITTMFPSMNDLRSKWNDLQERQHILDELENNGISIDQLMEITKQQDVDPFDLLCFVAFDLKPLTRKQRADLLKKNKPDFFAHYSERAKEVLNLILEKYVDYGLNQIRPDIISVEPIAQQGNPIEIVNEFGGIDEFKKAINELQTLLYAEAA